MHASVRVDCPPFTATTTTIMPPLAVDRGLPPGYEAVDVRDPKAHTKWCCKCRKKTWNLGECYISNTAQPYGTDKVCEECLPGWLLRKEKKAKTQAARAAASRAAAATAPASRARDAGAVAGIEPKTRGPEGVGATPVRTLAKQERVSVHTGTGTPAVKKEDPGKHTILEIGGITPPRPVGVKSVEGPVRGASGYGTKEISSKMQAKDGNWSGGHKGAISIGDAIEAAAAAANASSRLACWVKQEPLPSGAIPLGGWCLSVGSPVLGAAQILVKEEPLTPQVGSQPQAKRPRRQ
jgi:hypothetical protein